MGNTLQKFSYSRRKLAIASTLAVGAAALMVIYGAQARGNGATTVSDKAVLVATRDIPLGTPASAIAGGGWVTAERLPAGSVAAGALTSISQLRHLVAVQPTYSGEQITGRRFGRVQQQGVSSELTGSFRIIELSGSATQLLAGTLQRGNRVDVVGSVRLPETGATHVAAVVLRNLLVVQVPPAEKTGGVSGPDTLTAQLQLTPLQAQRLFWLTKNGDWSLLLRPSAGAKDLDLQPVTAATLLAGTNGR
jgi:Flp pilus assembly protein CpaB